MNLKLDSLTNFIFPIIMDNMKLSNQAINMKDKYSIIKEINHGMIGTVYLVERLTDRKHYALKIERVLETDINAPKRKLNIEYETDIMNEIYFCEKIKDDERFCQLIEYDFVKDAEYKQKYTDFSNLPSELREYIEEVSKSHWVCRKVYTLIDTTLKQIKDSLNRNEMIFMLKQVYNSIKYLHSLDYLHRDLHTGNIGYIRKTNQYQIIDYGSLIHIDQYDDKEKFRSLKNEELNDIVFYICEKKYIKKFMKDESLFAEIDKYKKIRKRFSKEQSIYLYYLIYTDEFNKLTGNESVLKVRGLTKEDIHIIVNDNVSSLTISVDNRKL